jgi:radical SAM protein with 4Fe4S-binding SPASM domain
MDLTWGQLSHDLKNLAIKKRVPLMGQFELTPRCNLQCKMCYICRKVNDSEALDKEKTTEQWIRLAKEAKEAGMLYLLLTGGEVFLRPDFRQIYEELAVMGFNIEIYTNATMITEEVAEWLGKMPPSRVGVTLYGASPETYARVCGDADGFNRAVGGIDRLLAAGITVQLRTTVIRSNVSDFEGIARFAKKRGLKLDYTSYITPPRVGKISSFKTERLSPDELAEFEIFADRCLEELHLKRRSEGFRDNDAVGYEAGSKGREEENLGALACGAGQAMFWVTWDGLMTPCPAISSLGVIPFEKGFTNAWSELNRLSSSVPVCQTCKGCNLREYCFQCPGDLKSEGGHFDKPAEYFCELAQRRAQLRNSRTELSQSV